MKQSLSRPRHVLVLLMLLLSASAKADVWETPRIKTYFSNNRVYKLIVTPSKTPEKYHQWQNYKNNWHPQTKRVLRKKEKFMKDLIASDTIAIPCSAQLYKNIGNDSILVWSKKLLNYTSPVHAIVADDGSSIATFDNWYSTGYGGNVFVVYNEKGEARRTYKLEEFSPFPLNDYLLSISSIFWRKSVRYIDNERIEIEFENGNKVIRTRIYDVGRLMFEERKFESSK